MNIHKNKIETIYILLMAIEFYYIYIKDMTL